MRGDVVIESDDLCGVRLAVDVEGCKHEMGEADVGFSDEREEGDGAAVGVVMRLEVDDNPRKAGRRNGRHLL